MEFNELLKERRLSLNLTQEEVAKKLYVTRQAVSNWETGKNLPDFNTLILLTDIYKMSLDSLAKESIKELKKDEDIKNWNKYSYIVFGLAVTMALSVILFMYSDKKVFVLTAMLSWVVMMYFLLKVERIKKKQNLQTYNDAKKFLKKSPNNNKEE